MTKPTKEQIINLPTNFGNGLENPTGGDEEFYHQAEKELNEGVPGEEKSETFLE